MNDGSGNGWLVGGAVIVIFAALMSALLIVALYPWLERYALAKPNARSSHRTPTPQGGGIAVIAATLGAVGVALAIFALGASPDLNLPKIVAAALIMTCLGAIRRYSAASRRPAPDPAGGRGRGRHLHPARSASRGAAIAVVARTAPAADRRLVVRQPGQLHGRHRLDDRRGSDTDHRHAHGARHCGRAAVLRHGAGACARRRHDRICLFQSARRPKFSLATSAVFRSVSSSVGCCCWSPAAATWSPLS